MTADTSRLVGRRVLVVGASAGIGKVIGETLCEAGAHVAFASRRKDVCEAAAKEAAGTAIGLECDVTDEAQCRRASSTKQWKGWAVSTTSCTPPVPSH